MVVVVDGGFGFFGFVVEVVVVGFFGFAVDVDVDVDFGLVVVVVGSGVVGVVTGVVAGSRGSGALDDETTDCRALGAAWRPSRCSLQLAASRSTLAPTRRCTRPTWGRRLTRGRLTAP